MHVFKTDVYNLLGPATQSNPTDPLGVYTTCLCQLLDRRAPLVTRTATDRTSAPWMTLESRLKYSDIIWKSELSDGLEIGFFRETVESLLLYGLTAWTLTQFLNKKLDGAYTKMLRVVKNETWQKRITNEVFYAGLPRTLPTLRKRGLRFRGHCWRSKMKLLTIWFCGN